MDPDDMPRRAPSLREQVYESIRRQIRNGAFPHDGVVELGLTQQLRVSRTPVREALFQLCREGMLIKRGRGYHLPVLDQRDRREIRELRGMIEPEVAALAVRHSNGETRAALHAALQDERKAHEATDVPAFAVASNRFRDLLLASCGNRRLEQMLRLVDDQIQQLRLPALAQPENREIMITSHIEILAAMERDDGKSAAEAMRRLLDVAARHYDAMA